MLIDRGFVRVRPLAGGLDAWVAAGYAIDSIEAEVVSAAARDGFPLARE